MSADFTAVFGESIRMTRWESKSVQPMVGAEHSCMSYDREVVRTTTAQPFLISGSGTLGWDQVSMAYPPTTDVLLTRCHSQVSANLVEPGENVLVLNTGYFGDSFADWCAYIRDLLYEFHRL
jgi:alanine-glyoxylate transaminase/serine-glyoxylate transaminase/serine-pyruvate transaminase